MTAILAENITRRYPTGRGLHALSFTLPVGACLGIVGDNGSGKTTLIRLLAGIDRLHSGSLMVLGEPACPRPARLRRQCGVALDSPGHWEALSGRQNLWFFARSYGVPEPLLARRVDHLLDEAALLPQADESVAAYSFGMRRKLAILQALCHDPELLILDEPTAGVDTEFLAKLIQWIHDRTRRGQTTCIADNNADWLTKVATEAVLLNQGRLTAQAQVADLLNSLQPAQRLDIILEESNFSPRPQWEGLRHYESHLNHLMVEANGDREVSAKLLQWIARHNGTVRSLSVRTVNILDALRRRASERSPHDAG